jgi:hypothetical protein
VIMESPNTRSLSFACFIAVFFVTMQNICGSVFKLGGSSVCLCVHPHASPSNTSKISTHIWCKESVLHVVGHTHLIFVRFPSLHDLSKSLT